MPWLFTSTWLGRISSQHWYNRAGFLCHFCFHWKALLLVFSSAPVLSIYCTGPCFPNVFLSPACVCFINKLERKGQCKMDVDRNMRISVLSLFSLRRFLNSLAPTLASFAKKKLYSCVLTLLLIMEITLCHFDKADTRQTVSFREWTSRLKKIMKPVWKSCPGQPVGTGCQVHSVRRSVQWRIWQPFKTTVDRWVSKTPVRWKETLWMLQVSGKW